MSSWRYWSARASDGAPWRLHTNGHYGLFEPGPAPAGARPEDARANALLAQARIVAATGDRVMHSDLWSFVGEAFCLRCKGKRERTCFRCGGTKLRTHTCDCLHEHGCACECVDGVEACPYCYRQASPALFYGRTYNRQLVAAVASWLGGSPLSMGTIEDEGHALVIALGDRIGIVLHVVTDDAIPTWRAPARLEVPHAPV